MTKHALRVLEEDEAVLFGQIENLGTIIWRRTPTLAVINRVTSRFPALAADPRGFALLAVLTPGCAPVDTHGRAAFDQGMREHRDSLLGIAIVIEVEGVLGGLTRAIARTMSIVSRTPYPVNTYATVKDATQWLSHVMDQRTAVSISAQELLETLGEHHARARR